MPGLGLEEQSGKGPGGVEGAPTGHLGTGGSKGASSPQGFRGCELRRACGSWSQLQSANKR